MADKISNVVDKNSPEPQRAMSSKPAAEPFWAAHGLSPAAAFEKPPGSTARRRACIASSQAIPSSCCLQQRSIVFIGGFGGNGGMPSAMDWNTSAENFQ